MFAFHAWQVTARIPPHAIAHHQGWIQFGGTAFVLATAQMNAYLLLLPQWVTAIYFTACLFGFAGWNTSLGRRCGLTITLYLVGFGVVGQEFNQYWGVMIGPLLCFVARAFPPRWPRYGVVRVPAVPGPRRSPSKARVGRIANLPANASQLTFARVYN